MKCALLTVALVVAVPSTTAAADYPHRQALISRSRASGVGVPSVPLLERVAGPGASVVGSALIARWAKDVGSVQTKGTYTTQQHGNDFRYLGKSGWRLVVRGDGTAVDYRNDAYRAAHRTGVPASSAPSQDQLSAWGRQFVASNLVDVISLSANEELVELRAVFEKDGGASSDPAIAPTSEVVGATVVFSRTINGIDVVGSGSKVAISFGVDGVPYQFRYDWPTYSATGTQQRTLSMSDLRRRDAAFLAATSRPQGVLKETERYFECGYFDAGIRRHDPSAPIQTGCFWQRVQQRVGDPALNQANPADGILVSATSDVIPGGQTVVADKAWPQAFYAATGQLPPPPARMTESPQNE